MEIGFVPSCSDECIYYCGSVIFCFYVDGDIFVGPDDNQVNQAIKDQKGLKFDIKEQGDITDYLGVKFEWLDDGRLKLS
eukprot:1801579-Ditylum_brightwellii.AAC.1